MWKPFSPVLIKGIKALFTKDVKKRSLMSRPHTPHFNLSVAPTADIRATALSSHSLTPMGSGTAEPTLGH